MGGSFLWRLPKRRKGEGGWRERHRVRVCDLRRGPRPVFLECIVMELRHPSFPFRLLFSPRASPPANNEAAFCLTGRPRLAGTAEAGRGPFSRVGSEDGWTFGSHQ